MSTFKATIQLWIQKSLPRVICHSNKTPCEKNLMQMDHMLRQGSSRRGRTRWSTSRTMRDLSKGTQLFLFLNYRPTWGPQVSAASVRFKKWNLDILALLKKRQTLSSSTLTKWTRKNNCLKTIIDSWAKDRGYRIDYLSREKRPRRSRAKDSKELDGKLWEILEVTQRRRWTQVLRDNEGSILRRTRTLKLLLEFRAQGSPFCLETLVPSTFGMTAPVQETWSQGRQGQCP